MTTTARPASTTVTAFAATDAVVRQIRDHQWALPTPCTQWDVRALVNHLVAENRWAVELLAGRSIADVGTALDGDLLGDDPLDAWARAHEAATAAIARTDVVTATVQLSAGDTGAAEYLAQLGADHLVHAWDLATAIGADDRLDGALVDSVADWFASNADGYRAAGLIAPPAASRPQDDAQRRLLAAFGRDADACATTAAVARFGEAFDRHDVAGVLAAMTDDCVFESTAPPDGRRYEGKAEVGAAWTEFFAASSAATFRTEDSFVCGDRFVAHWHYAWGDGHVRGVDVFRVRDGRVAEKLSYVKG